MYSALHGDYFPPFPEDAIISRQVQRTPLFPATSRDGNKPPFPHNHRRSMEKEAKANRRCCFMGENCRAHASIQTV